MSLYVDPRHVGHFGTGRRYAAEVMPRLGSDRRPLDLRIDSTSPR